VTRRSGRAGDDPAGPFPALADQHGPSGDSGMVTAEFAVALPAFVLVVIGALSAVAIVTAQLRCADAAGIAARMASRGDTAAVVRAAALEAAPHGARVDVVAANGLVTATVAANLSVPLLSRLLPSVVVHERQVAALEGSDLP
jgi:hypothetical protein